MLFQNPGLSQGMVRLGLHHLPNYPFHLLYEGLRCKLLSPGDSRWSLWFCLVCYVGANLPVLPEECKVDASQFLILDAKDNPISGGSDEVAQQGLPFVGEFSMNPPPIMRF